MKLIAFTLFLLNLVLLLLLAKSQADLQRATEDLTALRVTAEWQNLKEL